MESGEAAKAVERRVGSARPRDFGLEAVNFDGILLGEFVLDQERTHVLALVSLQLKNLPKLLVFNDAPVAAVLCGRAKGGREWRMRTMHSEQLLMGRSERREGRQADTHPS